MVNLYKVLAFKERLKGVNFAPRGYLVVIFKYPDLGELKPNAFFALNTGFPVLEKTVLHSKKFWNNLSLQKKHPRKCTRVQNLKKLVD